MQYSSAGRVGVSTFVLVPWPNKHPIKTNIISVLGQYGFDHPVLRISWCYFKLHIDCCVGSCCVFWLCQIKIETHQTDSRPLFPSPTLIYWFAKTNGHTARSFLSSESEAFYWSSMLISRVQSAPPQLSTSQLSQLSLVDRGSWMWGWDVRTQLSQHLVAHLCAYAECILCADTKKKQNHNRFASVLSATDRVWICLWL